MQRHYQFRPSRYLAALLFAAHGATLAVLFLLPLPLWTIAALAMLILFSMAYHVWRDAWLAAPSSAVALKLEDEHAVLTTRAGRQVEGTVLGDSFVTPYLTVLNVLPDGARMARSIVILPDSLDAESFRQLRVWLKWGVQEAA
jgi:toxin CptA